MLDEARNLEKVGAGMIVLEAIPAKLAKEVTESLRIPTIGIGAGVDCSGQVLVLHDMLDIYPGKKAKFVKNFMRPSRSLQGRGGKLRQGSEGEDLPRTRARVLRREPDAAPAMEVVTAVRAAAQTLRRRARAWPSCRPWATCTRGISTWCALRASEGRARRGEHLREPPAVRPRGGFRSLPAHASKPTSRSSSRLASTWCSPRTSASCIPCPAVLRRAPADRERPLRRIPPRTLSRRGHGGAEAVQRGADRRSPCSARRITSSSSSSARWSSN